MLQPKSEHKFDPALLGCGFSTCVADAPRRETACPPLLLSNEPLIPGLAPSLQYRRAIRSSDSVAKAPHPPLPVAGDMSLWRFAGAAAQTPSERLNGETKRRTDVVGIFPNEDVSASWERCSSCRTMKGRSNAPDPGVWARDCKGHRNQ
jgi:hypothetical protein